MKITPLIVAYLKSTEDHLALRLHIRNIGEGLAKNVSVRILNDYAQFGLENRMLSNLGVMKNGLNIFPPKEEFIYFVDSWKKIGQREDFNKICIELDINYDDINGKSYNSHYNLPFIQVSGKDYTTPPETYIGKIAYHLGEIDKSIKNIKLQQK
jgi:hypothetical protein